MNPRQRQQLLAGLQQDGLLDADRQAQLQGEQPTAWWLQLLLALAAWVAALFILSSLMAPLLLIGNGPGVRVLFGVLLLIACGWLFRQPGAFVQQLALAFSLAGQALLVVSLVELFDHRLFELRPLASVAALLAAALWWLPASRLHRMLCSLLVLGNLALLIGAGDGLAVYALLLAGLTAFGWLSRADWCVWPQARFIKPTLHALGLVALGLMLFGHQALQERLWQFYSGGTVTHWLPVFYRLGAVVLLLVMLAALWAVTGHERTLREGQLVLLELAPVDPRSLMQGDYMALRFAVDRQLSAQSGWPEQPKAGVPRYAWLRLDEQRRAQLVAVDDQLPPPGDLLAMRVRRVEAGYSLGPNVFFFEEGQAEVFEAARWGAFRVAADGTALLTALYDQQLQVLGEQKR
ncbi:MAG: GDYXXLXY domain-containing protein [Halopseudomonas yangmingensis]